MATELQVEHHDGRAVVTLDRTTRRLNVLSSDLLDAFGSLIDELESSEDIESVVLRSGKPDHFIVGADLVELQQLDGVDPACRLIRRAQAVIERWSRLSMPTVAVIHGAALGGGLELAMASTYRVASDDPRTVLGLPEVRLGLTPALGGTYLLPRLVGLEEGLSMLLTGRRISAQRALEIGLVDAVAPPAELLEAAAEQTRSGTRSAPLAAPGGHRIGDLLRRRMVLATARKRIARQTAGLYPAPGAILDAVARGLRQGRAAALEREARSFGQLVVSPSSVQLVQLFLATRELDPAASTSDRPAKADPKGAVGVVGAGFMGKGIAAAADLARHPVVLNDTSSKALEDSRELLDRRIAAWTLQRRISGAAADAARQRFSITQTLDRLAGVDLAIEAVFEDLELKLRVLKELEQVVSPDAMIGSNTSTLPISSLAAALRRPDRFLGLHFFSPVHRMPLLEIVRHPGTSERTVDRALGFAGSLGKTPIVVRDGPGFYTSRILSPYLAQGAGMLQERLPIDAIDGAARAAGFPVGPLELLDEIGIDVAARAGAILAAAFPTRAMAAPELDRMVEAGRLGRKSGRGFYDYRGQRKRPDESLHQEIFGWPSLSSVTDLDHLGQRLLLSMAAEAVRCLDDGILQQPRDGDVGAVLGLGFPPFRGGPFRFLDDLGAEVVAGRLERLEEAYGASFECPDSILRQAATGSRFYPGWRS